MSQDLAGGDFLVFQLEAGYGLLRLLAIDDEGGKKVWHLAAYGDLFPDVDSAETAAIGTKRLHLSHPHLALTERAFESTQVARIASAELKDDELAPLLAWRDSEDRTVSDLSVRLMLGLR
jgi:hypothetical protein